MILESVLTYFFYPKIPKCFLDDFSCLIETPPLTRNEEGASAIAACCSKSCITIDLAFTMEQYQILSVTVSVLHSVRHSRLPGH